MFILFCLFFFLINSNICANTHILEKINKDISIKLSKLEKNEFELIEIDDLFKSLKNYYDNKYINLQDIKYHLLPNPAEIKALLYTKDFISKEYLRVKDITNKYKYEIFAIYNIQDKVKSNGEKYHKKFAKYIELFHPNIDLIQKSFLFEKKIYAYFQPLSKLANTHWDAYDLFVKEDFIITKENSSGIKFERGPAVLAYIGGLVIAARGFWDGWITYESYAGGGLSHTGGNAIIIYNPYYNYYVYYAHLNEIIVNPGDVVKAGDKIGYLGNTGMYAIYPGRGSHVHFAIFQANNLNKIHKVQININPKLSRLINKNNKLTYENGYLIASDELSETDYFNLLACFDRSDKYNRSQITRLYQSTRCWINNISLYNELLELYKKK